MAVPGINPIMLLNPQLAVEQAKIQRQQALAQQLLEQSQQQPAPNTLANPGGFVVPYTAGQGLASMAKALMGRKMLDDTDQQQATMYQNLLPTGGSSGGGITGDPFNATDMLASQLNPEAYKASLALRNAGPMKAAEVGNTPYVTPQGTYQMGNQIMGGQTNPPSPASAPLNNPGNLRPVGASSGFMQFPTPDAGFAALKDDLTAKIHGSPAMAGKPPTLSNIITAYAPPSENNTPAYISNVAKNTGLDPNQILTDADVDKLIPAITKQEGNASMIPNPATGPNSATAP